jgi:hypothetical protein
MDIRLLYKLFESQGSTIIMSREILGAEIARVLRALVSTDTLTVDNAEMTSNVVEIEDELTVLKDSTRQIKLELQPAKGSGKRSREEENRWARVDPHDAPGIDVLDLGRATLRYTNYKRSRTVNWTRQRRRRRPRIEVKGTFSPQISTGHTLNLQVLAKFRARRRWDAEWEIWVFGFPAGFPHVLIPGLTAPAWRNIQLGSPALCLASSPFNSIWRSVVLPLEPGVNFAALLGLPANLNRFFGNPGLVVACGRVTVGHTNPMPEVDLSSFPRVKFSLGPFELSDAFLSIRSRWVESAGEDPVDAEPGSTGFDAGGESLQTEVAAGGYTEIEGLQARLWTGVPHDNAILVFEFVQPTKMVAFSTGYGLLAVPQPREAPVRDLASLDAYAGGDLWRKSYRFQESLANGHPYLLRGLSWDYDLVGQRLVNTVIHVESCRPFGLVGIDNMAIKPYTIGWNIRFTAGQGENPVLITADGILNGQGLGLYAVLEHPSFTIFASTDNETVDPIELNMRPLMKGLTAMVSGAQLSAYTGLYLEIKLGSGGFYLFSAGLAGPNDEEITWS